MAGMRLPTRRTLRHTPSRRMHRPQLPTPGTAMGTVAGTVTSLTKLPGRWRSH
jgi:hypothetical protein